MNKREKTRLTEVCCAVWSLLTTAEREQYYYDCGTIGFIEVIATMLYIDIADFDDTDFDEIINVLDNAVTC